MTLDLDELIDGWPCPPGELRARVAVGRDGQELIQVRVDLGLMQMFTTGRPDGQRYRGLPSAQHYIERELRLGRQTLEARDWQELHRELLQLNYRRLAYCCLAEDALDSGDAPAARRFLRGALTDVDHCLAHIQLLTRYDPEACGCLSLRPTLVFDRARLLTQLHVVDGRYEEAIEEAESGAEALESLLTEIGFDQELRDQDPGVRHLRDLGRQLRMEYGITRTLRERLDEAVAREDFEEAAALRDEMRRREAERRNATDRPTPDD